MSYTAKNILFLFILCLFTGTVTFASHMPDYRMGLCILLSLTVVTFTLALVALFRTFK
jgi:hypothetical protein